MKATTATEFFLFLWVACVSAYQQIQPPVLPLAVRNPYLSLWCNARDVPWQNWPMFWSGDDIGLAVMARLSESNTIYSLLGRPQDAFLPLKKGYGFNYSEPAFLGSTFDAHSTTLNYSLGNDVRIELYFSSPITPDSIMRQSLPASYLKINVHGTEDVDIYVDINGKWVTNKRDEKIHWDHHRSDSIFSWAFSRKSQLLFTEYSDRAEWGTMYFTTQAEPGVTYQSSVSGSVRKRFAQTGALNNVYDRNFRGVMDHEPVFAFAKSLKLKKTNRTSYSDRKNSGSMLLTFALPQDPVAQFAGRDGLKSRRPLWKKYFSTDMEMVSFHYADYAGALKLTEKFSKRVTKRAVDLVDSSYGDLITLSARQVLGATYFSGTPKHPIIFLKEISSNGNFQTVDVIFPAMPFFLVVNPDWLIYLLEPLLEHQAAGFYPNPYSIHDLGAHFPNATGHTDGLDEPMPLEESGNMLIMALAYAQYTTASSGSVIAWLLRYRFLWEKWTDYLVSHSLYPEYQLSTDDFAGRLANQTNLALKGIVAIRAMSSIAALYDDDFSFKKYKFISETYLEKWQKLAFSRDGTHTKLAYQWYGSWGTLYNLYGDALLFSGNPTNPKTEYSFVPKSVYTTQSAWYTLVMQEYGLPLDSRHLWAKNDWEIWAAATIPQKSARNDLLSRLGSWINDTTTDRPLTDLYDSVGGGWTGVYFMARPVVGGWWAVLALDYKKKALNHCPLALDGKFEERSFVFVYCICTSTLGALVYVLRNYLR